MEEALSFFFCLPFVLHPVNQQGFWGKKKVAEKEEVTLVIFFFLFLVAFVPIQCFQIDVFIYSF
jgi:hypothetical protein